MKVFSQEIKISLRCYGLRGWESMTVMARSTAESRNGAGEVLESYIRIQEQEARWEWHGLWKLKAHPLLMHQRQWRYTFSFPNCPTNWDQAFWYVSQWGPFSLKLPQTGTGNVFLNTFISMLVVCLQYHKRRTFLWVVTFLVLSLVTKINLRESVQGRLSMPCKHLLLRIYNLSSHLCWIRQISFYALYMHEHIFIIIQRHIVGSQRMKKIPSRQQTKESERIAKLTTKLIFKIIKTVLKRAILDKRVNLLRKYNN